MLPLILPFLASFATTALLTPLVILAARRLGWVARPRADRWHKSPTALMGGIGIFGGALAGWAVTGEWRTMLPLLIASGLMFVLGFVDDRVQLRPHHKLLGQIAACAIFIMAGNTFHSLPPLLSLPITLFWLLGITNAVNLLDNMDGLAAGVSAVCAVTMAICAAGAASAHAASAALVLAGACAAFLLYNFNPARIFMGDCGSMFIGFSLAAMAVNGAQRSAPNLFLSMLVPVAVLAIPIFDTTLVSVVRTLNGRSISQGGRDHTSHRLVALGLSERGTVLVLYALTGLFGGLAVAAMRYQLLTVAVLAGLLFGVLAVLGIFLGFLRVYSDEAAAPSHARLLGGKILYKRQMMQLLLDAGLVPLAFLAAYLLRFDGDPPAPVKSTMLAMLPMILVAKLVGLASCRAYRGVWRCAGAVDAVTTIAGSTFGSLLAISGVALLTGFGGISRAAFITDWLVFTVLVVGVRMSYVLLREMFGMLPAPNGPRVLILGAGDEGMALLGQLRDVHSPHRATVIGFLDDNPGLVGRTVKGTTVLGSIEDLPIISAGQRVTYCLLGVPYYSDHGREIVDFCHSHKMAVYVHPGGRPLMKSVELPPEPSFPVGAGW